MMRSNYKQEKFKKGHSGGCLTRAGLEVEMDVNKKRGLLCQAAYDILSTALARACLLYIALVNLQLIINGGMKQMQKMGH